MFSKSASDSEEIGYKLGQTLKGGDIVLLYGDLGAGKTTLIKGIGRAFGVERDSITSPTFVLMHMYTDFLIHFDLYRLKEVEEFTRAGFQEYLEAPYITLIEWPELIKPFVKGGSIEVRLSHQGEGERELFFTGIS